MTPHTSKSRNSGEVIGRNDESVPTTLRVALVDPHLLLAEALVETLGRGGVSAVSVWDESAGQILASLREFAPDAALVECELGEPIGTGLTLVEPILELDVPVIMLTGGRDPLLLAACLEAGAAGYVDKRSASFTDFLETIHLVVRNGELRSWDALSLLDELRRSRAERHRERAPFESLTPREVEVLSLMCEGYSAAEIAEATYVSLATVRSHIRSILLKLGVKSQLAAAAKAYRSGWLRA